MPQKYQLKNGMNVVLIESQKSPVVSIQMWVKTGSADEKKGIEGISHFIEHLVFKGSKNYGVGEIAYAVEAAGGVLNAYTSFDQTVFYVTLSKSFSDTGLNIISEMMGSPVFDEKEIDNEREVVIEEIKRSLDNPHQRASRLLFSNAYKKHPYGVPVIGFEENIRKVSRKEIVKYYQSRYVPQNMNLIVVGDFKTKEMREKVSEHFAGFKKFELKKIVRKKELAQTTPRYSIQSTKFLESLLYLSWPAPTALSKDALVLNLMTMIFGQGESSRLNEVVRNQQKLVNHVGSSAFTPQDAGLIAISAGLNNDNLVEVLKSIKSELLLFLESGCTQEELDKAKHIIESEKLYSLETVDGLAGLYGHFEFLHKDYMYFDKVIKQIAAITTDDILKIAKKYFVSNKLSVSYLTSGDQKKCEDIFKKWTAELRTDIAKIKTRKATKQATKSKVKPKQKWTMSKTEVALPAQLTQLDNGVRIITRQIKGTPVISVRAGFLGGMRAERDRTRGANELLSRVWSSSTTSLTEEQLNKKIESMASGLSAFGGRNTIGLSMTALVPYFSDTLEIFNELMTSAALSEHVIARESEQMLENIRSRNDKPSQICILNLAQELFHGHPYGMDPYGGEKDIRKLNRQALIEHMASIVSAENLVVSATGDFDTRQFIKKIEEMSQKLHRKSELNKIEPMSPLLKNKHVFVSQDKEQSHVAVAYRGLCFTDENRYSLEVMQSILSGQGGRLFTELRDKASLAYTVSPLRMDGIDGGYFGAYIGCSPEKSAKAIQMIHAEFEKLMKSPVSNEEMDRAKRYLLGRHDISLQRTSNIVDHYFFDTIYGLPFNEMENFKEKLDQVKAQDLQRLANKIFSQNECVSIVGKTNVEL